MEGEFKMSGIRGEIQGAAGTEGLAMVMTRPSPGG